MACAYICTTKAEAIAYCWVMKLADMPSRLGGEEQGINRGSVVVLGWTTGTKTNRLV